MCQMLVFFSPRFIFTVGGNLRTPYNFIWGEVLKVSWLATFATFSVGIGVRICFRYRYLLKANDAAISLTATRSETNAF